MNTENDESGLTPVSRQNIEEIDSVNKDAFGGTHEIAMAIHLHNAQVFNNDQGEGEGEKLE